MKNRMFLMLLASLVLSSCGSYGYYSSSLYDDGIYYKPDRVRMMTATEAAAEIAAVENDVFTAREATRDTERYTVHIDKIAADNSVYDLADDETYESRLRKFDDTDTYREYH